MPEHRIIRGDCVDAMAQLPPDSIDAIVCDPPYGLGFMGKDWDEASRMASVPPSGTPDTPLGRFNTGKGPAAVAFEGKTFQAWSERWATEALRILKPGGHLLAFGGTRTYHRLACAVEDAGFKIRDSLIWLYGSGFPKSLDVSKAIDKAAGAEREERPDERWAERYPNGPGGNNNPTSIGSDGAGGSTLKRDEILTSDPVIPEAQQWQGWGTALKPAHEPIVVARKPLAGTVAANVLEHGTGALNVDGCRVGDEEITAHGGGVNQEGRKYGGGQGIPAIEPGSNPHNGRWPPNVILSPESAAELDRQSGERPAGVAVRHRSGGNTFGGDNAKPPMEDIGYGDTGGASRFFYCAKASRAERNAGLGGFEEQFAPTMGNGIGVKEHDPETATRKGNVHPTVKPIALMRWLVRLVTPPGGTVLDPFTGSGTTGAAAVLEGFDFIGIEREDEYAAIAQARVAFWAQFPGADVDAVLASDARAREIEATGQLGMDLG